LLERTWERAYCRGKRGFLSGGEGKLKKRGRIRKGGDDRDIFEKRGIPLG